jgi:hypothetical protein
MIPPLAQAANRVIFITDSMHSQTYGTTLPRQMALHIVQQQTDVVVHNLGSPGGKVVGDATLPGAESLISTAKFIKGQFGAQSVVITIGSNDFGLNTPLATYKAAYKKLVTDLKALGLPVMCVAPVWRYDQDIPNQQGLVLQNYIAATQQACAEANGFFVTFPADSATQFADGLHFNPTGHNAFAQWLINLAVYLGAWHRI